MPRPKPAPGAMADGQVVTAAYAPMDAGLKAANAEIRRGFVQKVHLACMSEGKCNPKLDIQYASESLYPAQSRSGEYLGRGRATYLVVGCFWILWLSTAMKQHSRCHANDIKRASAGKCEETFVRSIRNQCRKA